MTDARTIIGTAIGNHCAHTGEPESDPVHGLFCADCRKIEDEVHAALSAAGKVIEDDWQPIETAEKTGEARFLACAQSYVTIGFWGDGGVTERGEKTWRDGNYRWKPIRPTHWRRLPRLPTVDDDDLAAATDPGASK